MGGGNLRSFETCSHAHALSKLETCHVLSYQPAELCVSVCVFLRKDRDRTDGTDTVTLTATGTGTGTLSALHTLLWKVVLIVWMLTPQSLSP